MMVKICGIQDVETAAAAAEAGADLLGFNFWPGTRRYVAPQAAAPAIGAARERGAVIVGVFVNQPLLEVQEAAALLRLDYVQLSGHEPPEYCAAVGRPVIKAIRLAKQEERAAVTRYNVAALLCDAAAPGQWGGTGKEWDWEAARALARQAPVLLAGGLTTGNVGSAIEAVRPWGVDVASGVETDGAKDIDKIRAFIEAAKWCIRQVG